MISPLNRLYIHSIHYSQAQVSDNYTSFTVDFPFQGMNCQSNTFFQVKKWVFSIDLLFNYF